MSKRILRLPEVKQLTGLSRSSIYNFMNCRTFPMSIKLGKRCIGWYEHDVNTWLDSPVINRSFDSTTER